MVCTIGPVSESVVLMKQVIEAGMNVGRLNFSHGYFFAMVLRRWIGIKA